MKKSLWIFILLILIMESAIFVFIKDNNNNNDDSYIAERTASESNSIEQNINVSEKKENRETKLSEFSTRLPNDTKARDDNIKLACKTLDGTIVKSGETFSFWENLGCPTKEKGYKEAKTFTSDGKVTESYGGGVCQISTTIYNAVLKVKGLEIKERHEHSRDVPYIKDGKDAAVSFDSADLKFKNTLDYDIRIDAKVEDRKVKIKLIRI